MIHKGFVLSVHYSRYILHHLTRLETSSADKLQEICSSQDVELDCVATKKTKLLGSTCPHMNECRLPTLSRELDYCNQLLCDPRTAAMHWQTTLIQRHLAWTRRLCQSNSGPVASFHNSLSA